MKVNEAVIDHETRVQVANPDQHNIVSFFRLGIVSTLLLPLGCASELANDFGDTIGLEFLYWGSIVSAVVVANELRQRISWAKRENKNKLQVSMSSIQGAKITMDKLAQGRIEDMLGADEFIAHQLIKLCRKTTDDDALVYIPKEFQDRAQAALKNLVTTLLQDPKDIAAIHRGEAEREEIEFWAAFTFERYGLKRNLIPRLIVVPAEDLEQQPLERGVERIDGDHKYLRVLTHQSMYKDIHAKKGPRACFKIKIFRAKKPQTLQRVNPSWVPDLDYARATLSKEE